MAPALVLCSQPAKPSTHKNSAENYVSLDTATCQAGGVQEKKKNKTIMEGVIINTIQAVENSFALTVN